MADGVKVTEEEDEGQASYRIETPVCTYWYHKQGGGFSSLVDADGNDWIGYHPEGGSAGSYRGIPNLVNPEGHFHPGGAACASRLVEETSQRATIESEAEGGAWRCRWEVLPDRAVLTVLKAPRAYWFLYEGTPGGRLDEERDFMLLSDGTRIAASERWDRILPRPKWIVFGSGNSDRGLLLIHHDAEESLDSYWPMQKNMTVFGFGRKNLESYLVRTPSRFTVALIPPGQIACPARYLE
jgi:hypothetical protein